MPWKSLINLNRASKERQPSHLEDSPEQSRSPSSVSRSRRLTPLSSSVSGSKIASDQTQSPLQAKLSPADGEISCLKDKSTYELEKLVTDKGAYNQFFNSLEQVKIQNKIRDELQNETLQLSIENLEKGSRLLELRNQCTIIRTTELAHAEEKLKDLERQKENVLRNYSLSSLLQKLRDSMDRVDEESEILHRQFLEKEIDLANFLPNYKKLRIVYHRRSLLYLAAQTSVYNY